MAGRETDPFGGLKLIHRRRGKLPSARPGTSAGDAADGSGLCDSATRCSSRNLRSAVARELESRRNTSDVTSRAPLRCEYGAPSEPGQGAHLAAPRASCSGGAALDRLQAAVDRARLHELLLAECASAATVWSARWCGVEAPARGGVAVRRSARSRTTRSGPSRSLRALLRHRERLVDQAASQHPAHAEALMQMNVQLTTS